MTGYTFEFMVDVDFGSVVKDVDLFADQITGHTVIMLFQHHIAIALDGADMSQLKLELDWIEWPETAAFYFFELLAAAVVATCEKGVVVHFKCDADSFVKSFQIEKVATFKVRVDASVNQFDSSFHEGFVFRTANSGR